MVRTGEVVDKADGVLAVVFERPGACAHCNGCIKTNCNRVDIPGEAEVGDTIDVEMPDRSVVGASAIAYILPLALFLAGLFAGNGLHGTLARAMDANIFSAICGLAGLALGLLAVHAVDRALRGRKGWQPQIIAVHKPEHEL